MIQRKAARFCMNNYRHESSVTQLIETLGWDSLQLRRKQARLSLMYKLSNNLIDINLENLLSRNHELRTRRSHVSQYKVPMAKIDTFKLSSFRKTIAEWNTLPCDVVNSSSLNTFKSKLVPFHFNVYIFNVNIFLFIYLFIYYYSYYLFIFYIVHIIDSWCDTF